MARGVIEDLREHARSSAARPSWARWTIWTKDGTGARRQLDWLSDHGGIGGLMQRDRGGHRSGRLKLGPRSQPLRRATYVLRYDFRSELPVFCGVKFDFRTNGLRRDQLKALSSCSASAGRCGWSGSFAGAHSPSRELRERTGISPSVLSTRLGELLDAGVLERAGGRRYRLSGRGRELARLLYELNRWAERPRGILAE